jgi:acyl-CoA thioester hydrolase
VLAHISVDYLQPVFLTDHIEASTTILNIGNKSLELEQLLLDRESGLVKCSSRSVMVCFDYENQVSIPLPEEWKGPLTAYLKPFLTTSEMELLSHKRKFIGPSHV